MEDTCDEGVTLSLQPWLAGFWFLTGNPVTVWKPLARGGL